jgi:hypothetical protein
MKSHPVSHATPLSHRTTHSSRPILLATFAVAAMFLTSQALAQTAQTAPDIQIAANPAQTTATPNAPVSTSQEAKLVNPFDNSRFDFVPAFDNTQGSNLVTSNPQSPHHGLAKTGAIVGTIFLGLGAGAFALAAHECTTYNTTGCGGFHTGGIISMAAGGAMAGTGYYFWFRK